ncbi:hypothetical protein CENTIMANUS_00202 [Klebsiella phage vB_KpM_Centimanus]
MAQPVPGTHFSGTKDESLDFDSFTLSDAEVEAATAKNEAFIEAQPEIEASDDCEGGACKI